MSKALRFLLVFVIGWTFGFFTGQARGAEFGDTGHIIVGTNACQARQGIEPSAVKLLLIWDALVTKQFAFERGDGPALTDEEVQSGAFIESFTACANLIAELPVTVVDANNGFVLFRFDPDVEAPGDLWMTFDFNFKSNE